MKKLILLFLIFTVTQSPYAQKKLKSGIINYQITEIKTDNPAMGMLKGSEMKLSFAGDQQKMEMSMMGGLVSMATITHMMDEKMVTLLSMMGRKIKVNQDSISKHPQPKYEITYYKDRVRKIAGYNCYEAELKTKKGTILTAYITNKIHPRHPYFDKIFSGLDGWPLSYTVDNNGMLLTFEAQSVSHKIDAQQAFLIPAGYEAMTAEELKKEMGAFNLGF